MTRLIKQKLDISSSHSEHILLCLKSTGAKARLIGGCVRDALLGYKNQDVDIATNLLPEHVMELLKKQKIHVVPTGLKHGTVTAFYGGEQFEITTLRKDVACDGRHAEVEFTDDFKEDAARRDFTINALSYCPFKAEIYDYFSGIDDLKQGKVLFIGNAGDRIQEDALRILRFFRFSCYYSKQVDDVGLEACVALKEKILSLSKERIKSEMDKLLSHSNAANTLQKMFESGILQIIYPINKFDYASFDRLVKEDKSTAFKDIEYRYAILFYGLPLNLQALLNLKFSRAQAKKVLAIISFIKQPKLGSTELRRIWYETKEYESYIAAAEAVQLISTELAEKFISEYKNRVHLVFPVNGNDLLKQHLSGKVIGKILPILQERWIESDFSLTKQELLEKIKDLKLD